MEGGNVGHRLVIYLWHAADAAAAADVVVITNFASLFERVPSTR